MYNIELPLFILPIPKNINKNRHGGTIDRNLIEGHHPVIYVINHALSFHLYLRIKAGDV